jgi:hypothetical protein
MKMTLIIIGLLTNMSCANDTKAPSSISTTDKQLNVYSDILDELVEKHFYSLYLGTDFEKLEEQFDYDRDQPEYISEVEKLRIAVASDTTRQRSICVGNEFSFVELSQLSIENFNDSINNPGDPRNMFKHVSSDYNAVYHSLITPQQLSTDHFHPSSFKVNNGQCEIGMISFSKVFFNTQGDKGLLYYEFVCDEKCGKGEILTIENKAGLWTIQKNGRLWIL